MSRKQKKMLIRIIIASILLIGVSFVPIVSCRQIYRFSAWRTSCRIISKRSRQWSGTCALSDPLLYHRL